MNAQRIPAAPGLAETVFLGLGGNMGDRLEHLRRALVDLRTHPEIEVAQVSRVYESEFVGDGTQQPYLNACAEVRTRLAPRVLLTVLKSVESRHGRPEGSHLQPRPLDLDILLFGDRVADEDALTLPHPRLRERAFVLEPLAEIAAGRKFPDSSETVAAACAKIRRKGGPWVRLCENMDLSSEVSDGS